MKRSLQFLILPLVFGIFFSNCASDTEKREASRPMSPWVFRSVIDAQPRMVTLALDKDLYAAYRTDSCAIYKVWKGGVNLDGAVYTSNHGPQPATLGDAYFVNQQHQPWSIHRKGGKIVENPAVQYRGHRFENGQVTLQYELKTADGTTIKVNEKPEFTRRDDGLAGFERTFTTENVPADAEVVLATNISSVLSEKQLNTEGGKFQDNIYVVFAGGDDCFMVGAWDAVFEFAKVIHDSFKEFTNDRLRLSASLTVIDEKYPVIRFARLAEDALKNAKELVKEGETNPSKNKISVFNQVLEWDEYNDALDIAHKLEDLIKNKGESRAIIERIKQSRTGFEKLQNKVKAGFLKAQEVWRLQWFLRSSKNKEEMQKLLDKYHSLLLKAATSDKKTNPIIFPVAARWAEFLTKNKADYVNPDSDNQ